LKNLKDLIKKAKQKDQTAMEKLFDQFQPLLKSRAKKYSHCGLKYDDVFQQASLIFVIAVYDYHEKGKVSFSGYIKKRIDWGLYLYNRKFLKRKVELSSGLNPYSHE